MKIREIVVESEDPQRLARFWADVLTGFEIRPYDEAERIRLASVGRTPDNDPAVAVDGPWMTMFFRETTRPKTERGRLHLDLVGQARVVEVGRVTALGARIKAERDTYTVMQDPEGNEFCIQDPV